jgi:acyl-CoA reductase-like NAD-dependent aldehyde dehydrogenase
MSGLAALLAKHNPPSVYQWHNAAPASDVAHAVEKAGWAFRYLDGWTVEDRSSFLKAAASALDVPDAAAESLETLADAFDVLDVDGEGLVLLWDGWSPLARHDQETFDRVLGALRSRSESEAHGKLAVILRGEGPDLDLDELPIKH